MVATTHHDATAFAARFLDNPDDRLGRLVFADWLDERGDDSSVAWSQYLREIARIEEEFGCEWAHQGGSGGRGIRARLTPGRVPGTSLLRKLTTFLPEHRIAVRIGTAQITRAVTDVCPGNLARLYGFMPVGWVEPRLFVVATGGPFDPVRTDVENFLSLRVTAFRGETEDVHAAIMTHYGQSAFEVCDTGPDFFPVVESI